MCIRTRTHTHTHILTCFKVMSTEPPSPFFSPSLPSYLLLFPLTLPHHGSEGRVGVKPSPSTTPQSPSVTTKSRVHCFVSRFTLLSVKRTKRILCRLGEPSGRLVVVTSQSFHGGGPSVPSSLSSVPRRGL